MAGKCNFYVLVCIFFKEALKIFNTRSLAKYLKAVEELKNNASEDVKLSLEEESRGFCAKWEVRTHICRSDPGPVWCQSRGPCPAPTLILWPTTAGCGSQAPHQLASVCVQLVTSTEQDSETRGQLEVREGRVQSPSLALSLAGVSRSGCGFHVSSSEGDFAWAPLKPAASRGRSCCQC